MAILTVLLPGGEMRQLRCEEGERLIGLIRDLPGAPDFVCGGNGLCGKCTVKVSGGIAPKNGDGTAQACLASVTGDATVDLSAEEVASVIEDGGEMPAFTPNPLGQSYGTALDIGTTTMVLRLYSLTDGKLLSAKSCLNPQRRFAADVIGRMTASLNGEAETLKALVRGAEEKLLEAACGEAGISRGDIDARVVTGNTTMLYLYTGRDPESLARVPFAADCLFGFDEDGVSFPPCFSAYVGADTSCAVLASGMTESAATSLLVDLGTNGELALWHNGHLYCCSTAAGPAFEGASVSCGSMSIGGAIDKVWIENGAMRVHVIGDGEAKSICGSGLIDAVACLLKLGLINRTGRMSGREVEIAPGVMLTQKDIREIQPAKSAILSGIETLLAQTGLKFGDIETLYLAGGFGKHIDVANAVRIGLIPQEFSDRVRVLGNAALAGASMLLLDKTQRARAQALCKDSTEVSLASGSRFSDFFIGNMVFPE